jgi:hypothetical protein
MPRPRRRHDAPQVVACRWTGALGRARELVAPYRRLDPCRGTRLRGSAEPPERALVDCGAPACAARTRAYAAELAAAGAQP